jgi:hypothetical protein
VGSEERRASSGAWRAVSSVEQRARGIMKKRADLRWNSLYPIYFDAKVSIAKGRRVPREYALWWPQAQHLSVACRNLGLQSCLEVSRTSGASAGCSSEHGGPAKRGD